MLLNELKELDEGKWDYDQASKGKGAGWSQQGDGGAKNRKQRKAFRKAEKKKKHQAMMRGEKWAQETVDEGFKGAVKGAAFAALAATAMSGTYGYDKLLRDRDPDDVEVSQESSDAYYKRQRSSKSRLLALAKRTRAKRMNPKASKTENMPQSGSRPSDAEAGMGSTTHGSRYQGSLSSVND